MRPFTHILFPIDFSDRSKQTAPFVERFARDFGAKVTLLHAVQPIFSGPIDGPPIVDLNEMLNIGKQGVDQAFPGAFQGIQVDRVAEIGAPSTVIVDYAQSHGVDLIMMASHGYGPFRELLLGSTAAKVLHDAQCPVWTTAHTESEPNPEHLVLQRIVCAVDDDDSAEAILQKADAFAKQSGASLRVVHVVSGIEAWPERQMDIEFEEEMRRRAKDSIEKRLRYAGVDAPVCVGVGPISRGVAEEARRHGAPLVIIGRGKSQGTLGRLRTQAHAIIRNAPCPVLSL